mgnify:CR=1 FL=1
MIELIARVILALAILVIPIWWVHAVVNWDGKTDEDEDEE